MLLLKPNDAISFTGMGVCFGNLGWYQEAMTHFEKASKEKPNSIVINNYKKSLNDVISKYPYTLTEKLKELEEIISIPEW